MRDVFVVEAAHYVNDGVAFADIRQKFIAQPFAFGRAFDQTRNVHEFDDGGGDFFGVIHFAEYVQPFVGNGNDAHVRFDGAEGIICAFRPRVRDRVEKRRFAYVRQAHYAEFHFISPFRFLRVFFFYNCLLYCKRRKNTSFLICKR